METKVTAVNGHGHLTIGGLDTVALASKYGTPLYAMSEGDIEDKMREGQLPRAEKFHGRALS